MVWENDMKNSTRLGVTEEEIREIKNDTMYGLRNDLKNSTRLGVTEEEIREIKNGTMYGLGKECVKNVTNIT